MTIEQKKISLINWITNLEDETLINQMEDFRKTSLNELPKEIVKLLEISDSESFDDCIEHTNTRDILNRK
jgi:lipid II:glycine glycyltransferase (peptidoglycan interpeptide bridge formation enzyme)